MNNRVQRSSCIGRSLWPSTGRIVVRHSTALAHARSWVHYRFVLPGSGRQHGLRRYMVGLGLLCATLVVLGILPAHAQFRPVSGREYREYYNPVNPVRGEAVIGVSIVPTEVQQRGAVVQVLLPASYSGEIHLETATADGRFRGEGDFAGMTKDKGWVSLPLSSAAPPDGKPVTGRPASPLTLAAAARGSGDTLFLVRWGDSAQSGAVERVRLYVNSRRADMFVRAGARVVRCAPIGIAQPVRFDSYCDVSISDIPANGEMWLIRRDQFDEQTQPLRVLKP